MDQANVVEPGIETYADDSNLFIIPKRAIIRQLAPVVNDVQSPRSLNSSDASMDSSRNHLVQMNEEKSTQHLFDDDFDAPDTCWVKPSLVIPGMSNCSLLIDKRHLWHHSI
jgi:hypothetical protein